MFYTVIDVFTICYLSIPRHFCIIGVSSLSYLSKLLYLADCGPPPMVERAVLKEYTRFIEGVRLPGTLEGVTRVYECQANTVAEGMTSTVCQIDGQWSTTNLYCRRKF